MIGIDISGRSIKIVQLSGDSERRLLSHCWRTIPDGVIERGIINSPDLLQKVLKEALEKCRLSAQVDDAVVASIPETQSFLRVIELPIMAEDEMDEAVQWEVAQHIPFGLENVYIDWQSVGGGHKPAAGRQEVLVGAAQKKVVDPLLTVLQAIGLDVAALELESQAIVRALISSDLRARQGLLVIDLGETGTNVIIHDHGAMRFTASLERGSRDLVSALSGDDAKLVSVPRPDKLLPEDSKRLAEHMRSVQEELVVEVRGIVEFYNGIDAQHEVREILLTGGGSNFPGFDKVFLSFFDEVHVQRGDPWANILPAGGDKKAPLSLRESVHFTTALGLALRDVSV